MKRATILMLMLGLLALPASVFAQGEDGEDAGDETTDEEAEPVPAEEVPAEAPETPEVEEEAPEVEPATEATPTIEPVAGEVWSSSSEAEPVVEPEPEPEPVVASKPAVEPEPENEATTKSKPDFSKPGERYRRLGTAISLSIGGNRVAVFDEGLRSLSSDADLQLAQWELGVMVTPRLGVSVSGLSSPTRSMQINGPYDAISEISETRLQIEPTVSAWEATARFVATPPFFPVRGFVRAGGGMYLVHVRVTDLVASGNLAQRDYRGTAPFATVGLGAEISTPTQVRDRAIPLAMGLVIEGGVRVGGGGEVIAAPNSKLDELGGMDLGPWYFRVAFQTSFWPAPKVPRAVQ